jgi:predicted unusual protein kinase regulating ubiquinone biosynthesis (AarF/ABC1/UbiB family)
MAKLISSLGKDYYFSSKKELVEKLGEVLSGKVGVLEDELGQLKGSFLKAGQMLSLYAQDLLPEEVENLFTQLQSQSSYLSWEQISKQIPKHILDEFEIEPDAFAAASIGQVHKAVGKDGHIYALKVQYKNIEKVIDMDLRILRWVVGLLKIVPKNLNLDNIFEEIKLMLIQEMDYEQEVGFIEKYSKLADETYLIPKVYTEFCSKKVICIDYVDALTVEEAAAVLNQEDRNRLGREFFELFFKEIFDWHMVQSDAHLGNYLIKDGKWVLLDFGATKEIDPEVASQYQEIIKAIATGDRTQIRALIDSMELIDWEKSNQELLWDYFHLISEPFRQKEYDWGNSNISKDAMNMSRQIYKQIIFKYAPHQTIFIDRKISGLFYMLKTLSVNGDIIPRQYLD